MTRFRGEYINDRKTLHNAVREEAGNRCIRCGHPQGDRMLVTSDPDSAEAAGLYAGYDVQVRDDSPEEDGNFPSARWRVFLFMRCTEHCTHEKRPKLRILTVHHLDGHKANNAWWNLLALCQVCHLQVQGKVIPEQPYLWPHTPWFIPYACGFYAKWYGGLDITREEADASPDRWLALGQPWLYPQAVQV